VCHCTGKSPYKEITLRHRAHLLSNSCRASEVPSSLPNMNSLLATTLVIPIHSEKRWVPFLAAINSVRRQSPAPDALIVSVDHNLPLLRRITARFPDIYAVENLFERGASGTRNSAALVAETPLLVFLDSDIRARDGWLRRLLEPFADPSVVGTGGRITARWPVAAPRWFPDEFGWVVGVSYRGQPTITSPVRNVWSSNLAVRRDAFNRVHGFRVDFSKVDDSPKSEDTDLCLRVTKDSQGGVWMFVPEAVVEHEVGPERCSFRFFVRRCFSEGKGKVELAYLNSGRSELREESNYFRRSAPAGIIRYSRLAVEDRDFNSARRGAAIIFGLGAAGLGAFAGESKQVLTRAATLGRHQP
jgi:glucosyl-dolichyl phosphate glucuronosyltransferase